MASIHKDPRGKSPYWYGSFTLPDGKRAFRSTKIKALEKCRGEALSLAEKWQREADVVRDVASAHLEPLTVANQQELIEGFISATQKLAQGTFTATHAQTLLNKILEAGNQAPISQTTVADFLTSWANSKAVSKAKGTAVRYQHTVKTFLAYLGKRSTMNLSGLVPSDFESFRDHQIKEGKSAATANMVIKTLRIPFNLARRQGLLLTNPAEAVDLLRADGATRDVFTFDQLRALIGIAPVEWQGMILIGGTTGCRIGDAARMTWGNVDFQNDLIRYSPQKAEGRANQKKVEAVSLLRFFNRSRGH